MMRLGRLLRGGWSARYVGDDVNEVVDLVVKGFVVAWYPG